MEYMTTLTYAHSTTNVNIVNPKKRVKDLGIKLFLRTEQKGRRVERYTKDSIFHNRNIP